MRLNVKILIPVWGEAYVRRFAKYALPSLLAPGNLPALAGHCDVEFLVLTKQDTLAVFETEPAFARLRNLASVKYIRIDDLVAGSVYGVTLTLAYTRGIASVGPGMVDTYFVFLNADFVLADGSLRSLLARLIKGERCILAPSFRANAEEVEPKIEQALTEDGCVLSLAPRKMVHLAMQALHPTTLAKTVNQEAYRSTHPNQLYWIVDDATIIGRFHLIFMFCIRPERAVYKMNSYCDYGFVPEFCPSAKPAVVSDSDELFLLECQKRMQEVEQIRFGHLEETEVARHLSEWTTKEHRFAAQHDLVFHAADLPPTLPRFRLEAKHYLERLSRLLGPPRNHAFHEYWTGGVRGWANHRPDGSRALDVPELAPHIDVLKHPPAADASSSDAPQTVKTPRRRQSRLVDFFRKRVYPIRYWFYPAPWHHHWLDHYFIHSWLRRTANSGGSVLLVGEPSPAGHAARNRRTKEFKHIPTCAEFLRIPESEFFAERFDTTVCVATWDDLQAHSEELLKRTLGSTVPAGEVLLLYNDAGVYAPPDSLFDDLILALMSTRVVARVSAQFLDGQLRRRLRHAAISALQFVTRKGIAAAPLAVPLMTGVVIANLVLNLWSFVRRQPAAADANSGSVAIRICKESALSAPHGPDEALM